MRPQGEAIGTNGLVTGLIASARPRQWMKNLLVFAAPVAAGVIAEPPSLIRASVAFASFTLAAAGIYILNDVADREADAGHPEKRSRPIASGRVGVSPAVATGIVAVGAGVAVPFALGLGDLMVVVLVYVASALFYSWRAKRIVLLDIAIVAAGFVLRAVAGAVAVDVPISQWFLIVTSFGALYVVATKRYAESRDLGRTGTRVVLLTYTDDLLREVRFTSAAVVIVAYVLWAFENAARFSGGVWFELSIVPFVLAVYRYALAVHEGAGEAPEEILLRDHQMLIYIVLWGSLYTIGLYAL